MEKKEMYAFCIVILIMTTIFYFFLGKMGIISIYSNNKEYLEINEITKEQLLKIRNYEDYKYDDVFLNKFSLSFLKLARFPYPDEDNIIFKTSPEKKFMNWDIINKGNTSKDNYFFTLKNDTLKTVVIAFPGTLGIPQLFDEVIGSSLKNFNENSNSPILIGKYFGERTKKLFDIIFNEELDNLMKLKYQIITTGHSLGGAMAQCFMYFAIIKKKISKVNLPMTITYGQPKVGNYFFAQFLDKNVLLNLRFVNKNDIVHKIPICSGIYNYFKYFFFFDFIDLENIYYHTLNEIMQQNIIKISIIIKIMLILVKIGVCYVFFFFFNKIYLALKDFIDLYKTKKDWPKKFDYETHPYFYIFIFFILYTSVLWFFFKDKIIPIMEMESKLFSYFILIIMLVILAFIFYTFIILLSGFINLVYKKYEGIDISSEKIKDFKSEVLKRLFKSIPTISFFGGIFDFVKFFVSPHSNYQYNKREITNYQEKKKILSKYENGEYLDPNNLNIYIYDNEYETYDKINNNLIFKSPIDIWKIKKD